MVEVQISGNVDKNPVNPFPDPNTYADKPEYARSPTAPPVPATPPTAAPAAPARPPWLPAKFKSPEEMAASYAALEMKLGQPAATPPAPAPGAPATPPAPGGVLPVPAGLTDADFSRYSNAIVTTGALGDEHYAELAAKGIPRQAVDAYVAGQKAVAESLVNAAYAEAGGKDQYAALAGWAKDGLDPEVAKSVKAAFASNDRDQILAAVKTMKAMHAQSGATLAPSARAAGSPVASSQWAPIASTAELMSMMRSPMYKTDPAFREMVAKRLEVSQI